MRQTLITLGILGLWCSSDSLAKEIFVDNIVGNDRYDGTLDHPIDIGSGPVRTLRRAMNLANFSDRIVLVRQGAVYYDSLSLTGDRHSGTPLHPFTLVGNGAILSGLRAVPPEGWRQTGPDLWSLTFSRKGYYRLLRAGQPLPEHRHESGLNPLDSLIPGEWTAWKGSVYFRSDGERPSTQSFSYSADQTGLTLYDVQNVRIEGITFRDFRFDGLRAQNMCQGITLDNVTCVNNGRAGMAITGSSKVDVVGGKANSNGRYQILISDKASAVMRGVEVEGEPSVILDRAP